MIVRARNGIACSQSKTTDPTSARCAASQLAVPQLRKKNGPSRQSHATARAHGRHSSVGSASAIASLMSSGDPLSERDRENAPLVDALLDLAEAGGSDELSELGLGA